MYRNVGISFYVKEVVCTVKDSEGDLLGVVKEEVLV